MQWTFQTTLQRFDVGNNEEVWQHIVIPESVASEIRTSGLNRFVVTLNQSISWHYAVNITCEADHQDAGVAFVYVAKHYMKAANLESGATVDVRLAIDSGKYGMNVHPDLQHMLDEDADFLSKFDAMLPGKRRGHLLQINKAKSAETVAKRISNFMNDLGLCMVFGLFCLTSISGCAQPQLQPNNLGQEVRLGNECTEAYLPLLDGKRVAVVGNHTSVLNAHGPATHLVDTLLALGVNVRHVFAPEHGFRGEAANGADIHDGVDALTGLNVYSLHGKHRKPQPEQLAGVDMVVFDIQDVGARFYTYVSSLMLVMEACAEQGLEVVVLDRPNPHGHHMHGPLLDPSFKSFVGYIPTPMVHGMTLGELALMGSSEGWINLPKSWRPTVIPCEGWSHGDDYELSIRPSPNLPSVASIDLYPSLCLFEPTVVSVGRGTPTPFEVVGHPEGNLGSDTFTPVPVAGAAPHPKHEGLLCQGQRFYATHGLPGFDLGILWAWADWWREAHAGNLDGFITSPSFFDKLAGTDQLRMALEHGETLESVEATWRQDHLDFFEAAQSYFLYAWNAPLPGNQP